MRTRSVWHNWLWLLGVALASSCRATDAAPPTLILATTTSTQDSGLLDALLPAFEKRFDARVKVIAVGTGQALKLGADGNADVLLVHARAQEDAFIVAGDGIDRRDVMYNDFVVDGPPADPARVASETLAAEAFKQIAAAQAPFVSRGDKSGTHAKELEIWKTAGFQPGGTWYLAVGQGMGEALILASEKRAYTLSDRATFLAQKSKLQLTLLVGGDTLAANRDPLLLNPYGVIRVNPARHPNVKRDLAEKFAQWITSLPVQEMIARYGQDSFGQPLFYPSSDEWKNAQPRRSP